MKCFLKFIGILVLVLVGFGNTNTYWGRYVFWNIPDIYDLEKFPSVRIKAAKNQQRESVFMKKTKNLDSLIFEIADTKITLAALLKKSETRAFLMLKNDTLVHSSYYLGTDSKTNFKAFSMTKSILSMLVGIAIDEGKIRDVHQKVGEFELDLKDKRVNNLTIESLLLQNTQLQYDESYAPWADEPRWYYSVDGRALARKVKLSPTKPKKYENVEYNNYLMAMILEKTTEKSISSYLEQKLWQPACMHFDASFSIDSKTSQFEKVADGFNAKAIDFLNIGRLMLNKGKLRDKQIISKSWVYTSISFENSIVSDKKEANYKYLWWTKPNGDFYANGHYGQYIYVSPSSNTVIVRLSKESGNIAWSRDIFPKINDFLD